MFVKAVEYYHGMAGDASVTVSDGSLELVCFCCECRYRISDSVKEPLECFDVFEVQTADTAEAAIQKIGTAYYSYRIQGLLLDRRAGMVKAGGLLFHIDPTRIPKDIAEHTFICFSTLRADLWQRTS